MRFDYTSCLEARRSGYWDSIVSSDAVLRWVVCLHDRV